MKLKRETFMDTAIGLMWVAIVAIVSFFLNFSKMINERFYYDVIEVIVIMKITDKLLWWICGKIDGFEIGKKK